MGLYANVQLERNILLEIDNNQSYPARVTGPFSFHSRSNEKGTSTAYTRASHSLTSAASWFKKKLYSTFRCNIH
eukprot:5404125-Ditylum_brightwellii.AAC.1